MELPKSLLATFIAIQLLLLTSTSVSSGKSPHEDFLEAHNEARAQVGVRPLAWNNTVAAYARNYADKRIQDCNLEHSEGPYGENLAEGYGSMSGDEAVRFWETEKENYDHGSNSCVGGECLHYTQVVWRSSVHLGCASVKCDNGWVFVICNYDPPGNIEGQRPF